ncbi:MAG: hypothetical protein KBT34_14680, partial [Prevotella sp.]|nr:hypothetical protein [Candidatus Prevotella equi]
MTKDKQTYNIPSDSQPAMASEPEVAYSSQSTQEHIILTIPKGVDAEPIKEKVNGYYAALLQEYVVEQEVKKNIEEWLFCTGMFSGPNLCWDNAPFRRLQSMDRITLQMIDKIREDYPDYTQRHIGWLKRKL